MKMILKFVGRFLLGLVRCCVSRQRVTCKCEFRRTRLLVGLSHMSMICFGMLTSVMLECILQEVCLIGAEALLHMG